MQEFIEYGAKYYDDMIKYIVQHLILTFSSVIIALLIAIPISVAILKSKKLTSFVLAVVGCIYSIPSMALFAILMPFLGLGRGTAIVTLTLYCQFILVRNFVSGFNSVPTGLIETAKGMGLTSWQIFFKVKLPIASPVLIAGVRLCLISTIASAIIAQTINAGGIGTLIFKGLRTFNIPSILWGTLLSSILALICNCIFEKLERKAYMYSTGSRQAM